MRCNAGRTTFLIYVARSVRTLRNAAVTCSHGNCGNQSRCYRHTGQKQDNTGFFHKDYGLVSYYRWNCYAGGFSASGQAECCELYHAQLSAGPFGNSEADKSGLNRFELLKYGVALLGI